MIVFEGKLSEPYINYILKKARITMWLIALMTTVIISIPVIIIGLAWNKLALLFLIGTTFIGVILPSDTKKNVIANIPTKVIIKDDTIYISVAASKRYLVIKLRT